MNSLGEIVHKRDEKDPENQDIWGIWEHLNMRSSGPSSGTIRNTERTF
jgi:hypothetical protein